MINVKSLNQAIAALRAETKQNAITPSTLGGLLQTISNLLATATTESDLEVILNLQIALANLKQKVNAYVINLQNDPTFISHIVQGSTDRNNVYLNATKVNVAFGTASTVEQAVTIKQATTERAGVMRAQQVADLNDAKSGVTTLQNTMRSVQSLLSELQSKIRKIESETSCFYHIECDKNVKDGLHVVGASVLLKKGFVPYIFRFSRKKSRYRHSKGEVRRKGSKTSGWHVFCNDKKIKFASQDLMLIAPNDTRGVNTSAYSQSPKGLFTPPHQHFRNGVFAGMYVGYGCDSFRIDDGKRFRFAVAFGLPQSREKFDFTKLVTNMAEFGVHLSVDKENAVTTVDYYFSR